MTPDGTTRAQWDYDGLLPEDGSVELCDECSGDGCGACANTGLFEPGTELPAGFGVVDLEDQNRADAISAAALRVTHPTPDLAVDWAVGASIVSEADLYRVDV